ncbi:MAG: 2-C-methyl-D-erythritol 4-phosphate cytidylyltransferase, partial [Thermomicrobiales bacterium]|nr:2-C-methyl-D-erythritol 4-phosphate cytidylyltransferase [Thermomicrobiales bacterium]
MTAAAIIVAAGSGQRFGNAGKSFSPVAGAPMAWWSIQAANAATSVDEIVLVCGSHSHDAGIALAAELRTAKLVRVVLGGERRQDSALAGIGATTEAATIVAIHDAARPLVTPDLFDATIATARSFGAAIAAIPVSDTIKRVAASQVVQTVPRDDLVRVQTPQAFQKELLIAAFAAAEEHGRSVTDE